MATFSDIAFKLVFEVSDSLKALDSVRDKIAKDIGGAYDQAAAAQAKYSQQLEKLAQEQQKTAQQTNKTLQEESKLRQQLGKEAEANSKRAGDAEKKANAERQAEAKKSADYKKQIDQELARAALEEAQKLISIEKQKGELARSGAAKNSSEVKALLEQEAKIKESMYRREAEMVDKLYKEKLATVEEGSDEWVRIETERLKRIEAAEKKAAGESEKARKAAAGEATGLGSRFDEIGENFSTITDSLSSGNIAGTVAGLGTFFGGESLGKAAGIVGVVADQVIGLVGGLSDLAKQTAMLDGEWKKMSLIFQNNDIDITAAQITGLQNELKALLRPVGVTEGDIAKLSAGLANFTPPDKIVELTNSVLNLSRISGDVPLEELSAKAGQMQSALGDAGNAADFMGQVVVQLTGVTKNAGQAAGEMGKVFAQANTVIGDSGQAAKESGIIFSGFAKAGLDLGKATSSGEQTFIRFKQIMTDPALKDSITKQLPDGMSLMDVGLEKGSESVTKFVKAIAGMGDKGKDITKIMGGASAEGIDVLSAAVQKGTVSLDALDNAFSDVTNSAGKVNAVLTPISHVNEEIAQQRAEDAMNNLGRAFDFLADTGTGLLDNVLTGLAQMGGPLASLFVDTAVEAERAKQAYEAVSEQTHAFIDLADEINQLEGPEFIDQITANMDALEATVPGTAAEIQHLLDTMAEPGTAEYAQQLDQIKGLMEEAKDIKLYEEFQAQQEALEALKVSMRDARSDSEGMFDSWSGFMATITEASGYLTGNIQGTQESANAMRRSFSQVIADSEADLEKLRAERDALKQAKEAGTIDTEGLERLRDINGEIAETQLKVAESRAANTEMTQQALDAAATAADLTSNIADEEERRYAIMTQLAPIMQGQPDVQQAILSNMDAILNGEELRVEANGKIVANVQEQTTALQEQQSVSIDLTELSGVRITAATEMAAAEQHAALAAARGANEIKQAELELAQIRDPMERIAAEKHLADVKAQAGQDEINAQKQITDLKIAQEKLALGEIDKQIDAIDEQLRQVDALLQGGELQQEQLQQIAAQHQNINQIIAERKKAEETGQAGETQALELDLSGGKDALEQYKQSLLAAKDATELERMQRSENIKSMELELDSKDLDLQKQTVEDRTKVEEEAKKAVEEKAKAEEDATDAISKAQDAAAAAFDKRRAADDKAGQAAAKDAEKRAEEQKKALEAFQQALHAAAMQLNQFANEALAQASQEISSTASALGQSVKAIYDATDKFSESIGLNTEQQQQAEALRLQGIQQQIDIKKKELAEAYRQYTDILEGVDASQTGRAALAFGAGTANDRNRTDLQIAIRTGRTTSEQVERFANNIQDIIAVLGRDNMKALAEAAGVPTAEALAGYIRTINNQSAIDRSNFADEFGALSLQMLAKLEDIATQADVPRRRQITLNTEIAALEESKNRPTTGAEDQQRQQAAQFAQLEAADQLLDVTRRAQKYVADLSAGLTTAAGAIAAAGSAADGIKDHLGDAASVGKSFAEVIGDVQASFGAIDIAALTKDLETATAALQSQLDGVNAEIEKTTALKDAALAAGNADEAKRQSDVLAQLEAKRKSLESSIEGARYTVDKALVDSANAQRMLAAGYESALKNTEGIAGEVISAAESARQAELDAKFNTERDRVKSEIATQQEMLAIRRDALDKSIADLESYAAEQERIGDAGAASTRAQIAEQKNELIGLEQAEKDLADTTETRLGQAAGVFETMFGDNMVDQIQGVSAALAGAIDMVGAFIASMQEAESATDVVNAGADLAQQVGQALLSVPVPALQAAGAVLIGGAMIAKAVTSIIALFKKEELTQKEQAEKEIARQERINALYEKRMSLIESLAKLGDIRVDQAFEQLRAQKALMASKLTELELGSDMLKLDKERLAAAIALNGQKQAGAQADLAAAQELLKIGDRSDMRDFLESRGVDVGANSKRAMEEFIDALEGEIALLEKDGENLEQVMEMQQSILDLEKAIIDERLKLNDLRMKLGEDERKVLEENEKLMREQLEKQLETLIMSNQAINDVAKAFGATNAKGTATTFDQLSDEDMRAFLLELANMPDSQLSGPIIDMVNEWIAADDAVTNFNDTMSQTEDLFDKLKTRLGLLRDLGRISDTQFQDQMMLLLEERLAFLDEEREALIEAGATTGELLDNEIARLNIEKEIKDLIEGENAEMLKSDQILTKLVRERQRLLTMFRASGGGTLDAAQQAQLQAATDAAVARMRETGATEEQIAAFLAALPKYEEGGYIPMGGPKMMHPGEFVLPAPIVSAIGRDELERFLSNSPSNLSNSLAARVLTQHAGAGSSVSTAISFGEITINVNVGGAVSDTNARTMGQQIGTSLAAQMNKLIQEGNVRVNRG